MTATVGLEDVRFHAPHGFYEEEALMGNEFSIDVAVDTDVAMAATTDDLAGTVNYATIYYLLQAEMKKPTQLLEALAYRIANRIMEQFDGVVGVRLKLRKLHPPLGGRVGAAFVEVELGGQQGLPPGAAAFAGQQTFEDPTEEEFGDDFGGGGFDFGGFKL